MEEDAGNAVKRQGQIPQETHSSNQGQYAAHQEKGGGRGIHILIALLFFHIGTNRLPGRLFFHFFCRLLHLFIPEAHLLLQFFLFSRLLGLGRFPGFHKGTAAVGAYGDTLHKFHIAFWTVWHNDELPFCWLKFII